jgi:protein O-GlcNAc transferase
LCAETVKVLPNHSVFCYLPTDDYGEPDINRMQQRQDVVFGSFNNLLKVNAETLALWRDVLFAVPGSKLKLKTPSCTDENCRQYFLDYFTDSGIDQRRLIFSGPSSLYDMMREYNEMDIALDTFPYNGGTTTFQALWMAVPVLTMAGTNFCGRMGASAMTRLGMQDWVAHSREDFIDRAIRLAADRETLVKTKKGLREKMRQSPLCDAQGFGIEMGRVFEEIWAEYCEKP